MIKWVDHINCFKIIIDNEEFGELTHEKNKLMIWSYKEQHESAGGKIYFKTKEGLGTTFFVEIPTG